jgi:predicted alpha/beta-fold hydrolase
MGRMLTSIGYDVLLWNMRGCGREPNRLPTWYHSGKTDDLARVVAHAQTLYRNDITLVGVSIGGNITLKYLGEQPRSGIAQAVAISVPCDLRTSADVLALPKNRIYMEHLLRPLRKRIREKASRFPELFDCSDLNKIKTFHEFDRRFTAPMHGFSSVDEYWDTSSSLRYLAGISTPTLLVSALDDPFLAPECFPFAEAKSNPQIILETPRHGGHVGFVDSYGMRTTWIERRVKHYLAAANSKRIPQFED